MGVELVTLHESFGPIRNRGWQWTAATADLVTNVTQELTSAHPLFQKRFSKRGNYQRLGSHNAAVHSFQDGDIRRMLQPSCQYTALVTNTTNPQRLSPSQKEMRLITLA